MRPRTVRCAVLGHKWVVLDTAIDLTPFIETSDADAFPELEHDAHTKYEVFLDNECIIIIGISEKYALHATHCPG